METKVRVVGSGFTTFNYQGSPIAFMDRLRDDGQTVNGSGNLAGGAAEAITPIGCRRPVEIATSRVLNAGLLTLQLRETWNEPIWWQLVGLAGTNDLSAVFDRLAATPTDVTCQTIIKPPGSNSWRGKTYHGCVVVGIDDSETVEVATISVAKTIVIAYTHTTGLRQGSGGIGGA